MPQRFHICQLVLTALGVSPLCGCSGLMRNYDYFNPGDTRRQQSIAIAHDPYPLNDLGPPIAGGRPKNFDKPLSEVQRAQLYNPPKRPLQAVPTLQPTVVSPQPVATVNSWPAPPPAMTTPLPYSPAPPPVQTVPAPFQRAPLTPYVDLD